MAPIYSDTYCHTLSLHDALPISALSRWGANGIATSCTVSRRTGPRNEAKPCSATIAAISLAALHVARASSRITRRPVLRTEARIRSEEHTSELQSLMRISYAVFCLKKKKHTIEHNTTPKTS